MRSFFKSKENKKIEKQLKPFNELFHKSFQSKEEKLEELIKILEHSNFNSDQLNYCKQHIDKIIHERKIKEDIENFNEIEDFPSESERSKMELLDNFELLLNTSDLNSEDAYKYIKHSKAKSSVQIIFGILLMVLGLGMIVMPAPENFEMFTIFYFTRDDGITIMDVIAGLITVGGILLITHTIKKHHS